jgi:succinate dehydrogenase hydrophobic anchor subunit
MATVTLKDRRRAFPVSVWLVQSVTGVLLLVLLVVHMIANHFVAPGGLRTYAEVVAWLRNPVVFAVEVLFLVTVTVHAVLGVRSVLLDRGPGRRAARLLDRLALAVGAATIAYGLGLLLVVAARG